ncbi:sulfurtransferase [Comamonas testosteroni]|uniref:Sulfurtransferase n=1 Tax=Comamonas testosteroni TaxID=285 RepID=A0A5A7MJX1_COMTE|nr:sulfurtransferase [Comamonas testosteroni]GEQ78117.1 sulfurtransferase [Comamonas testosteroni]
MTTYPLISARQLFDAQAAGTPMLILDCSFDLGDPDKGRSAFLEEHVAGAVHVNLNEDLSESEEWGASGGRHPLPRRESFASWVAQLGLSQDMLAVVYDRNRLNFAGRLWWMLRWVGHGNVVVLDGGLQVWKSLGGATEAGEARVHLPGNFELRPPLVRLVDANFVYEQLGSDVHTLIDARAPERYRGEIEPLDAVAGHIPGALNRPFTTNLQEDGRLKDPVLLRAEFELLLGPRLVGTEVIHYCGSGVSAVPNVLAMEVAGLPAASLYAGSWSDWSRREDYPKVRGAI